MTEQALATPPSVETRYYQLADYNLSLAIAFIVIDTLAVGLRVWARKKQKLPLKLDDYLIFAALILTFGAAGAMIQCESSWTANLQLLTREKRSKVITWDTDRKSVV